MTPRSHGSTETRQRIIHAALTAFMHHGYNATTMDEIAAAGETSKGTLYWYFESKDDLLESAIRTYFEETFVEDMLEDLDGAATAAEKLRTLTGAIAEADELAKGLFNLYLEYWTANPDRDAGSELWISMLESYKDLVAGIIDEGIAGGEFREVDAGAVTWALLAMYDGLTAYSLLKPEFDLHHIHEAVMDTLLKGLEADP